MATRRTTFVVTVDIDEDAAREYETWTTDWWLSQLATLHVAMQSICLDNLEDDLDPRVLVSAPRIAIDYGAARAD